MPIEIKELHVKINVSETANSKPSSSQKSNDSDVVAECIEQIMQIIERQKER